MAQVIKNPKDGIDEMIEQGRAIESMLAREPHSDAQQDAREAMDDAKDALSRARAAVVRMTAGRRAVA